jgi:hypothetical protein
LPVGKYDLCVGKYDLCVGKYDLPVGKYELCVDKYDSQNWVWRLSQAQPVHPERLSNEKHSLKKRYPLQGKIFRV